MVKITTNQIPQLLKNFDAKYSCVLVYGPDEGLVRERADIIAKQVVDDLSDAFNVVKPDMASLSEHPSILGDELASISMLGGRRVIRLDGAGDKAVKPCEIALTAPKSDNLLIVTAGALGTKSKLRLLFEKANNAVALPCYADSVRDIETLIFEILSSHGLRAEAAAISYLTTSLGNDRFVTRGEVEKLALFKARDDNKEITLADAKMVVGDNNALTLSEIANAVAGGKPQILDTLLDNATNQGENPVAILRVLQKHLQQLHFVKGLVVEGTPVEVAIGKLYPKLFFKAKEDFKSQLYKWDTRHLAQALDICQKAEVQCKTTGMPDQAICARTCLSLSIRASQARAN